MASIEAVRRCDLLQWTWFPIKEGAKASSLVRGSQICCATGQIDECQALLFRRDRDGHQKAD